MVGTPNSFFLPLFLATERWTGPLHHAVRLCSTKKPHEHGLKLCHEQNWAVLSFPFSSASGMLAWYQKAYIKWVSNSVWQRSEVEPEKLYGTHRQPHGNSKPQNNTQMLLPCDIGRNICTNFTLSKTNFLTLCTEHPIFKCGHVASLSSHCVFSQMTGRAAFPHRWLAA